MAEPGVRVGPAQKAAAWQWLMRAGASADAPLHVETSVRGSPAMASSGSRPPSRFAHEAALLPQTPRSPLPDNVDLARLHQSARHRRPKLGQDEDSRISLRTADGYAEKKARMVRPNDRRRLHLHFLGFQKLLRKLLPSPSGRKSMTSSLASVRSDSEEEAQHRYVYHHHHHYHHYHYDGAGSPVDDEQQPHLSTAQLRRRRHSESGLHHLAQQYHLCAESQQIEEDDQQNEFSSVEQHFLRTISKRDYAPRHPMKPPAGGEAVVKKKTINNLLSPPLERTASERFTYTTNTAQFQFSDEDDETQSRVARCKSERRQPLHLQNRIISVDAHNHYFLSDQFFDLSNGKSPNVAAGAIYMESPAKRRPHRHSANFTSFYRNQSC